MTDLPIPPHKIAPRWQPLPAIERRVLGVLIEKGKTTPDQYPLSLNGLVAGCNQKSNRHPQTEYEPEQVQVAVDRLRMMGAAAEVQGSSRVPRYRHLAYEWLGVDKLEISVMAELLLRGPQTEGDLRGRAARMDPIADVAALRPILESLKAKRLLISLTSSGRGHVVTHALFEPRELEKQRQEFSGPSEQAASPASEPVAFHSAQPRPIPAPLMQSPSRAPDAAPGATSAYSAEHFSQELAPLQQALESFRDELAQLRSDLADLVAAHERTRDELGRIKDALGG